MIQSLKSRLGPQRRPKEESLLTELWAAPEEQRRKLLEEERFHSHALFALLLDASQAALPFSPRAVSEPMNLATHLAGVLRERGKFDVQTENEGFCRALSLAGTARRLLGDVAAAEAAFEQAGTLIVSVAGRGFFCRALGVLRWDQGRIEEAAALLHHAQRHYAAAEDEREEAVCRALLGLLQLLDGQALGAKPFFEQACPVLESGGRPWLAAQCWLGLAFCFAAAGEPNKAQAARQAAWSFFCDVRDTDMLLSLYWLEGRGATLAGQAADGEHLLTAVRRQLIERRSLAEATLATIDLGLALVRSGREEKIDSLTDELRAVFDQHPGFEVAAGALAKVATDAAAGLLDLGEWLELAPVLRLAFRFRGVRLRPVPFA